MASRPARAGASDEQELTRICWAYFREGQTQGVIAERFGITRKRVNQMLQEARTSGLVRVTINSPRGICVDLERQLVARYGLHGAVVVPAPADGVDVRTVVGAAAADFLAARIRPEHVVGINWGGTITGAAQGLQAATVTARSVVQLVGGMAESGQINPYDNAAMFARALESKCYYVTAPLIAETEALRQAYLNSPQVARTLELAGTLDIALLSAVDLTVHSRALAYGLISQETWKSLRVAGAVGDICANYLTPGGNLAEHPLNERTIGPHLDVLRRIPLRVLASGGAVKAEIARAGLAAGLAHVFVTDEACAQLMIEAAEP
jgi:DNA-binding transcriptional regulator LsrR (DeoR family)